MVEKKSRSNSSTKIIMNSTSSNSRLLSCLKMIMHWIKRLFYFIRAYKELYYFIEVKFFLILVRFILCSLKTTLNHDLIDASITTLNFPEVTIFLFFFFSKEICSTRVVDTNILKGWIYLKYIRYTQLNLVSYCVFSSAAQYALTYKKVTFLQTPQI